MGYTLKGECRNTGKTHFEKGYTPWNKGKTGVYSEETRFNMGSACRGKSSGMKGRTQSDEAKKKISIKISELMKGNTYCKGKPWSEARIKAQEAREGRPYKRTKVVTKAKKPVIMNNKEYHWDWGEIRKEIYKRDNWTCVECGVHCHNSTERRIQCHHIDYDISNNDQSNLITLCASCHCKTNFVRKDWVNHYENKMEEVKLVASLYS